MAPRRLIPALRHRLPAGTVAQATLVAGFLALIGLPALLPAEGQLAEKREPAPRPALAWKTLRTFPKAYERYWGDRLGLRRLLVRANALVKVKALRASPLPQVVVGRDGWLFFDEDAARGGVPGADHRGLTPWTPGQLARVSAGLEAQAAWLEGRGTAFALVVCPNKQTVYPELLPPSYGPAGRTRLDQLAAALAGRPVPFVDPRGALAAAKGLGPLYFRTDTHWNPLGALVAYREIVERLRERLPPLAPVRIEDFTVRAARPLANDGDIAVMLGLEGLLEDQLVPVRAREVLMEDAEKPGKVLLFHDSFGNALRPLLELHFAEVVSHPGPFDYRVIERERPDAVVLEMVERFQERLEQAVSPPPAGPPGASDPAGANPAPGAAASPG